MIINFKFFEARFSDIAKFKGKHKQIENELNKTFVKDKSFIDSIYLKDDNIRLFFNWNNSKDHDMIIRLKQRTNIKSMSELNNIFEDAIVKLFKYRFNHMKYIQSYNIEHYIKRMRLCLHITDLNIYFAINFIYEDLFKKDPIIEIKTILQQPCKKNYRLIEIF
jgi:pantothenate kinase-related protein Tda10